MIIFCEVASVLNYLHLQDSGIIHRDVSSANVLLEQKSDQLWKAKLSDFGLANLIHQSATVGPGAMVYAAPKVRTANGELRTPKLDVYSFGVLVTEVLLCKFPSIEEFQAMFEALKDGEVADCLPCGIQLYQGEAYGQTHHGFTSGAVE